MKLIKLTIMILLMLGTLGANELAVLETFLARDSKAFTNKYQGFDCKVDDKGALWVLYSLTRDNEWPQYFIDSYRPGRNFPVKNLGAYYGKGGWYDPVLCGISETTLESQVFVSNDYGRRMQYHELTSLSYSQESYNQIQYPGGVSKTSLCHIRKINDTTASAFSLEWSDAGEPLSVKFLKDFKLYSLWPDDYTGPFLKADTLWESQSPATFVYDERIGGTNVMAALYRHWEDDSWRFVCVDNQRVLFETDQAVPASMLNVRLKAAETGFFICWQEEKSQSLFFREFDSATNQLSKATRLYEPTDQGLESTAHYELAVDAQQIFLQIPILTKRGNSDASVWTSILRYTLRRSDLELVKTETVIRFSRPQDYVIHRISNRAGVAHSLIVTNDGVQSQLLYFGPIKV